MPPYSVEPGAIQSVQRRASAKHEMTAAAARSPITVLVADDSLDSLRLLSRILSRKGYRVECASDIDTAWNMVDSGRYDLAVLDWRLGRGTGDALARHIKATRSSTKIILVSAYSAAEKCGDLMDAFLPKPLNPRELTDTVERLVGPAA